MKLKLNTKILTAMGIIGIVCSAVAILVSNKELGSDLEASLIEKSRSILSRTEVSSHYVAQMNTLDSIIKETMENYPDGRFPEEQRLKILRSVPVYAAFQIGKEGAEKENYEFRIASEAPRNKENQATSDEIEVLNQFKKDPGLKEYIGRTKDKSKIFVTVPVRISEKRNCLRCHGHPTTSPYKNGKDILGYPMEDLKDGDIRATFSVISSLAPVKDAQSHSLWTIVSYTFPISLLMLLITYLALRSPMNQLASFTQKISDSSEELRTTSEQLGAACQQLASSSQQQSSSVEETSASLEEISGTVGSSVKGAQSSLEMTRRVSQLVEQGIASMSELHKSVDQIADANGRVEKLAKLIEEIGEKTELIDEIVFQTRLLSFNASVEAERAGEHGRGFAVVAQEVGNLAQLSGKSAGEISQIVKASIKEAQEVVILNRAKVEQGVSLCKVTSQNLSSIESASKSILETSEHILRSSEEQHSGIQQINSAIQQISQSTQENASSAEQISESSSSVIHHSESLGKIVEGMELLIQGKVKSDAPVKREQESSFGSKKTKKGLHVIKKNTSKHESPKNKSRSREESKSDDPWDKI